MKAHPARIPRWALALFAITVLLAATVLGFRAKYEYFHVPSGGSLPTVGPGDYILVDRWTYGYHPLDRPVRISQGRAPRRGELVVFIPPPGYGTKPLLKRVIALAGDRVEIQSDGVAVNGNLLPRCDVGTWRDPEGHPAEIWVESSGEVSYAIQQQAYAGEEPPPPAIEVPENTVYVLGDERDNSVDSRFIGPVPVKSLVGRVVWVLARGREGSDPESPILPSELASAGARCAHAPVGGSAHHG